jgi:hypothetical protein
VGRRRHCCYGHRLLSFVSVSISHRHLVVQSIPDHLERKEILSLLQQHIAESLDVLFIELSIPRR